MRYRHHCHPEHEIGGGGLKIMRVAYLFVLTAAMEAGHHSLCYNNNEHMHTAYTAEIDLSNTAYSISHIPNRNRIVCFLLKFI